MNKQEVTKLLNFKKEIGLPLSSILNNELIICFYYEEKDGKNQLFFDYWFTSVNGKKQDGYLLFKMQCPDVSKIPGFESMTPPMLAISFAGVPWTRLSPEAICSPEKPIEHAENILSIKWFSVKQFEKELSGKKEGYTNLGKCEIYAGPRGLD